MSQHKVEISDLKRIIHSLMNFIVIEGKEFVNEEQKQQYVESYLYLLIKTINTINEEKDEILVKNISDDISSYIK